tara:strand:+ start:1985 stop:2173 length:189 start_codon:yes stop_codon:yes gene_type:complete
MNKEELIEKHIDNIDIGFVIDSAMNGALDEIERQLIADNCPDDIFHIVKDEVFVNKIIIDRD